MGGRTVYPASKRFVQHFSRGLNQELKGTNVLVSVLHPGLMKTNEAVTRSIELHGLFGKIGISSPQKVAEISLCQLFRNHSFILVGLPSKLAWLLLTLVPDCIKTPLLTKEFSREFKFDHS